VNAYPAYGCIGCGIDGFAGWHVNAYPAYGALPAESLVLPDGA